MSAEDFDSETLVRAALREDTTDAAHGPAPFDVTSRLAIDLALPVGARIVAKAAGVVAGTGVARACFRALSADARVDGVGDGTRVAPGDVVLALSCAAGALLAAERTALNFLQRLSGIATMTARFVAAVAGTGAAIFDTRKTTPGWRALERAAVRAGGGRNHRFNLADQVLLKENHFALAACSYAEVVRRAVAGAGELGIAGPVIAEARDVDDAVAAVRAGAGIVMLDNFAPGPDLRAAVAAVRQAAADCGAKVAIEASGGIRLDNVREVARSGVDRISVGALTHSAPALDLSLLVEGRA